MSEKQAEYIVDPKESEEALEMLGKGYHDGPPKLIPSLWSGFTPAPDAIITSCGYVTALVWGKVWRYCQGRDGICRAKLERLGNELGMSERTIIRHLETLVLGGYLKDMTPDLKNKPHIYADTGKVKIGINVEATMTQSQPAMTQSQREGDRESVEDSIKKPSKRPKIQIRGIQAAIAMNRSTTEDDLLPETKPFNAIMESLSRLNPNWPRYGESREWERVVKNISKRIQESPGENVAKFVEWVKSQKDYITRVQWYGRKPGNVWEDWPLAFENDSDPYRNLETTAELEAAGKI